MPAGLREGQIAEFVEDDEIHARQMIGEPSLPTVAGFGLEPVDEIDHVVKPAADAGADAASGDGKMGFAGAGPADQHGMALLGDEAAAGEVVHERLGREERNGDQHDAYSAAAWIRRADLDESLSAFLNPSLATPERAVAQVEGWILGVA